MRNRYEGYCYKCGSFVPVGYGFFEKHRDGNRKWRLQCVKCCDGRDVKDNDKEVRRAKAIREYADKEAQKKLERKQKLLAKTESKK